MRFRTHDVRGKAMETGGGKGMSKEKSLQGNKIIFLSVCFKVYGTVSEVINK